ncbi:hypothetical protein B4915_05915 [Leucobacter massiliensis]|uniref:LysR substrate-binding domain-containing protein n=1 Tax=Leucobacter massiliensis TaxID=1686285 RepID=A0A2S9QPZ3_9MICO|nr:hypothetical protein B4915_05915 [Leucobacter massiliensis]
MPEQPSHPEQPEPPGLPEAAELPGRRRQAARERPAEADPPAEADAPARSTAAAPLRLGFARGTAPGKWAKRWRQAGGEPLELVALEVSFGRGVGADPLHDASGTDVSGIDVSGIDVVIERTRPGDIPAGAAGAERSRHALRLYAEAVALVVHAEHPLADAGSVSPADLALFTLLDHPDHAAAWPAPQRWEDPAWMPADAAAALELVASGAGAVLLPLPLARHLARKRDHAVLPVTGEPALAQTEVWASWAVERDDDAVQQLAGIMRGRTARSSRPGAGAPPGAAGGGASGRGGSGSRSGERASAARAQAPAAQQPARKQPKLKPNSRGAQLAAAREKAEREKAARRRARKRR